MTEGVGKASGASRSAIRTATGNVTTTLTVLHGTLTVLTNVSGGLTGANPETAPPWC